MDEHAVFGVAEMVTDAGAVYFEPWVKHHSEGPVSVTPIGRTMGTGWHVYRGPLFAARLRFARRRAARWTERHTRAYERTLAAVKEA